MKPGGRPPPINARCEGIATNGLFRSAYRSRRCLVPINGFFEWKDIFGTGKNKQPYAIAMADGSPFALAGIWEIWKDPAGIEIRNFAIVTCEPNAMMAQIHAEMNLVKLAAQHYDTAFLADCTLYTSTEPCAMCSGAIYWSGIGRMVFACSETRLGEIAGIGLNVPSRAVLQTGARTVTVVGPTNLEDEAAEVHQAFWPKHLGKA